MKSIILTVIALAILLASCSDAGNANLYISGRYIGMTTRDSTISQIDTLNISSDSFYPTKSRLYFSQGVAPITTSTKYITTNGAPNFNLIALNTRHYWTFMSGTGISNGDSVYVTINDKRIDSATHITYYTSWSYAGKKR